VILSRLLALCGFALLSPSLLPAAVPVDDPVAILRSGYSFQWIGNTGRSVCVANYTANVWTIPYTAEGVEQPATKTPLASGYRALFAAEDKALLEKNRGYTSSEGFRVIRLSDGSTLGDFPGNFYHGGGSPFRTAGGLFALNSPSSTLDLQLLSYPRGADSPSLRTIPNTANSPVRSLLAACDDWVALWGTESQIGNQVVIIYRMSDLTEIRRLTVRWQDGLDGLGAGYGNQLYFRTRGDYRCLDLTTGQVGTILQFDQYSSSRSSQAIDAAADGFWYCSPDSMEVKRYRGNPATGFEIDYRGGSVPSSWYGQLRVSGNLVHLASDSKIRIYDTQASKPKLLPLPVLPPVKEANATIPLPLTLDRVPDRDLTLRIRTIGGCATPGLDYEPLDQLVTFPAGTSTVSVPLQIKDDLVPESFETIGIEFADADGIRLPEPLSRGVVIAGSGLEWREFQFKDSAGTPLQTVDPQLVFTGVIAGPLEYGSPLHLWDRQTGNYRGATEIPSGDYWTTPPVIETPLGLESVSDDNSLTLYRANAVTGATTKRTFTKPPYGATTTLLGSGRVLVKTGGTGYSTPFSTRIYSFDGPADGTDFPMFGEAEPTYFSALSDGNHLVVAWGLNSSPTEPGLSYHIRWYRADTLEIEGEISLETPALLIAIRNGLLLYQDDLTHALDLTTGKIRWSNSGLPAGAATGTHVFGTDCIWEIATGLKVSPPLHYDSRLPDTTQLATYLRSYGPGGMIGRAGISERLPDGTTTTVTRYFDIRTDRQRPGLEWLGSGLRLDEEQAYIPFKSSEAFAGTFSTTVRQTNSGAPSLYRPFAIPASPFAVPCDRQVHLFSLTAPPEDPHEWAKTHPIEVRAEVAGAQPLIRYLSVPREDGTTRLPLHLTRTIPAIKQLNLQPFVMRYCDGLLVMTTGYDYPDVNTDGRVIVVNPTTGAVLLHMKDPAPIYRRAFALDALVQGDRLLVSCTHGPTGRAFVEIYELSTQRLLGSISDPSFFNEAAVFMDSTPTYFALSAASQSRWEKKSTLAVYRWSDLKPVVRKSGGAKSGLGLGVDLKTDRVFAGIRGGTEKDTGMFAQAVGSKVKLSKWPKGTGGQLIAGDPFLYLYDRMGMTRAYDPTTFKEIWSYNGLINGATKGTTRDYAWIDDLTSRIVSVLDGATGAPLASSRLPVGPANRTYTGYAIGAPGQIFFGHDKDVRVVALEDLGDFADTRRWRKQSPLLASLNEDLDGNGQPDFTEYLTRRISPGGLLGSARIEAGALVIENGDAPPADLVSLVEVEVVAGWWYPVAWRSGPAEWTKRALPNGTSADTPVRMRHLPHPTLGWFPPLLSWPPLEVAIPDDGANAVPHATPSFAARSAARVASTGTLSNNGQPLQLVHSGLGWGVEYLRPVGDADPSIAEFSHDLILWLPVEEEDALSTIVEPAGDGWEKVTIRNIGAAERLFFRLRYPN
jgi:hypothetical protein